MKKAQAAMEFIMTYGWAILVVLVAIAALAYFGVLSPSKFLPETCTFPPGLGCIDFKATTGTLVLVLQNGLGQDITLDSIADVAGICTLASPGDLNNGASGTYTVTACTHGSVGSKIKTEVKVTYTVKDTGLQHTKTGDVNAKVE